MPGVNDSGYEKYSCSWLLCLLFLEQMIKYIVPYMGKANLYALLAGNIVL